MSIPNKKSSDQPVRPPRFLAQTGPMPVQGARFPSRLEVARRPPATREQQDEQQQAAAALQARLASAELVAKLALERSVHAVQELRFHGERLAQQARADVIEIAFAVAQRILDAELHTCPESFFALVRSAVRQAGDSHRVVVRACAEDAALLRANPGATDGLTLSQIEVVDDESLSRGDVLVDADFGRVDGRLASRFAEVRRAVADNEGAG